MRAAGVRNWSRFHSLPLSKRYAETREEQTILLDRQNELACVVLGEGKACWLVQTCWTTPAGYVEAANEQEKFQEVRTYGLEHAFSFLDDPEDEEAAPWNVMAAPVCWKASAFDDTLLRIANEQAAPTLWTSAESGAVFAPYDGGVDVFLPSEEMAKKLRSRFADWQSPHPSGL